jgi:surface protein
MILFRTILPLLFAASTANARDFDNNSIRQAVNDWLEDPEAATTQYGPIERWKTWQVTDMSRLFQGAESFSANLNGWNTAAVTDMHHMFAGCAAFESPLDAWNVESVTDFSHMFYGAKSFTGSSLGTWTTTSAQTMEQMFLGATNFVGPENLQDWDTSRVTSMYAMFFQATSFDQPVDNWNMTSVKNTNSLFEGASKFSQRVCWPKMNPYAKCFQCFCGTSGAEFDIDSSCTASFHPSILAYSQACDPDDILEDIVENQVFSRPEGDEFVGDLGVSGGGIDGIAGLPSLGGLTDTEPEEADIASNTNPDGSDSATTTEEESTLETGDRGIDQPGDSMVIAAAQQEESGARSSRLVVSFLALLAFTTMFC